MSSLPSCICLDGNIKENQTEVMKMLTSDAFYEQKISPETEQLVNHFKEFIDNLSKTPYDPSCGLTQSEFNRQNRNRLFMSLSGQLEDIQYVENLSITNAKDNNEIPMTLFKNNNTPSDDLIIFIHGGGWTQGNIKTHEYLCRKLTKILEKDVLSLEYRLSPENPHPKQLEDILTVYKKYANSNYQRLILCGDSGGGHLCTATCIKIGEEGLKRPDASILLYPALGNDFNSRSYQVFGDCLALTKNGTIAYTNNLCGGDCQNPTNISNKYIFPVLQKDMNVFPREIIISSGYDVLYDGQLEHVKNMLNSGRKDITWLVYPGVAHGFMTYGKYYDKLVTEICHTIKKYL